MKAMSEEDVQKIAQIESVLKWVRAGHAMPTTGYYDLEWLVKKIKEQDSRINELENCCMHESTCTAIPQ